jgi:hypothetical protein
LKVARDRNRELDEKLRREEKHSIVLQERTVQLDEKNRDLLEMLKSSRRLGKAGGDGPFDEHAIMDDDPYFNGPSFMELQGKL